MQLGEPFSFRVGLSISMQMGKAEFSPSCLPDMLSQSSCDHDFTKRLSACSDV